MKHKRKIWTALVTAFCILAGTFALTGMSPLLASADVFPPELTVEQYTDSDQLLNSDGTESDKTIQWFAQEVKKYTVGVQFPEVVQIAPKEYWETEQDKAVFQYYGKEYGFYLAKDGMNFSLLLIDFVYEFDIENPRGPNEYIIKIDPILQCAFYRSVKNGGFIYRLQDDDVCYKYYVSNPRFLTVLLNENSLNFGDNGYSKLNDEGIIIQQVRANYGKVLYQTEENLLELRESFWVQKAFDKLSDKVIDILGNINGIFKVLDIVKDIREYKENVYEQSLEQVVMCDNESNITTELSKSMQRSNASIESYSRVLGFVPGNEVVLSDDDESNASMITLLSETNFRSRLIQTCEFDIVRRKGNYSSMEFVAGNSVNLYAPALSFQKERFLFEDQEPQGILSEKGFAGNRIPVYVLPGGEHVFRFKPQYSGKYIFEMPENADLYIDGNKVDQIRSKCEVYLNENTEYRLTVRGKLNIEKINSYMTCRISEFNGQTVNVKGSSNHILQYKPTDRGYQKLTVDQTNCKIRILDEDYQIIQSSNSNTVFANFNPDRKYYIVILNPSSFAAECNVQIQAPNSVGLGDIFYLSPDNQTVSFTNTSGSENYYKLLIPVVNVAIKDTNGNNIGNQTTNGSNYVYTFTLGSWEKCFICFPVSGSAKSAKIELNELFYRWKIDGELTSKRNIILESGKTHTVKVVSYYNNREGLFDTGYGIDSNHNGFTYSAVNGVLEISANTPNGAWFKLNPLAVSDFILTVTAKDYMTTIALNSNYPDGTNQTVKAKLNQALPSAERPYRVGYSFLGYYTSDGVEYYNSEMRGRTWDKDVTSFTLFAHWEKIYYTLTIRTGISGNVITLKVGYGDYIDLNPLPERDGYKFTQLVREDSSGNVIYAEGRIVRENGRYDVVSVGVKTWDQTSSYNILYMYWEELTMSYSAAAYSDDEAKQIGTVICNLRGDRTFTKTAPEYSGYKFKNWVYNNLTYENEKFSERVKLMISPYTGKVAIYHVGGNMQVQEGYISLYYATSSCVAEGTLITLADGSQVPVESLTGDEMLLVWNLKTGSFDIAPILLIDNDPAREYKIINLSFSDGTSVKVISEHGFWDFDLNRYVYLDENAAEYLGHWFNKQYTEADGSFAYKKVQLTGVNITVEYTTAWSPETYGHLCYYVNGMLSMPGGSTGLFNIFEVDAETMRYDEEAFARDIEQYGLFTYEEFNELLPVPEFVFDAYNGQYLKVAIGKGLITMEGLQQLAKRYLGFFE